MLTGNGPTDDGEDWEPPCDGRCIDASDLLENASGIAYADPFCSRHGDPNAFSDPFTPEEEEQLPPDEGDVPLLVKIYRTLAS